MKGVLVRARPILQFGEYRFDLEARLLTHCSRRLEQPPKALDILAALVSHAGRVVSKQDLLDTVWPHADVEEGNLAVHIFALRRALGEDAATAASIETIPKRGYRFAARIVRVAENGTSASDRGGLAQVADHYLQQQSISGCRKAAIAFRRLLSHEPEDASARVGLANTLLFRLVLGDLKKEEAIPAAEGLLQQAADIDPLLAGLHLSRSRLLCLSDWHWKRADEELQLAFETAPASEPRCVAAAWRGFHLVARDQFEEGLAALRNSCDALPLSTFVWRMYSDGLFLARDFSGCARVSRKALEMHPGCYLLYRIRGRALTALGEFGTARRSFQRAGVLAGRSQIALDLAYLDAITGNREGAVAALSSLHEHPGSQYASPVLIAEVHAALGNRDLALDYLEQACFKRDSAAVGLKQNSRFDAIRNTSRFRDCIKLAATG